MSELESAPSNADAGLSFGRTPERGGLPPAVWAVSALVVALVAAGLIWAGLKKAPPPANTLLAPDAYAASLPLSNLAMSESTSLSGGKLTYLDGQVRNSGTSTVTAVTVQVVFQNDEALPPHIETLPLALVRTREPYIDTEPIAAEPLQPSATHDFRLIFERVPENWNTQMPEVRIVRAALR